MFFGTPPSWLVTIRLPGPDLERLIESVTNGLPLRSANIEVPIEHGWQPDGSGKKWDNAAHPLVAIESYRLFFGEPEVEELIPDVIETDPAFQTEMKILKEIGSVAQNTRYILFGVLAAIILLLWWRR